MSAMMCSRSIQPRCVQLSMQGAPSRRSPIRGTVRHPTQAIFRPGLSRSSYNSRMVRPLGRCARRSRWRNLVGGEVAVPYPFQVVSRFAAPRAVRASERGQLISAFRATCDNGSGHSCFAYQASCAARRCTNPRTSSVAKGSESRSGRKPDALELHLRPTRHPVESRWGHHTFCSPAAPAMIGEIVPAPSNV